MTYNRNQARPLLTDGEYKLFISSLADHIGELDRKALGQAITRTRRARDKYRDLAKRQNAGTRERAGARGAAHTANERTDVKATIFGEALDRLENAGTGWRPRNEGPRGGRSSTERRRSVGPGTGRSGG